MSFVDLSRGGPVPTPSSADHLSPNAWVFPKQRIVWVAIAKNACTSIKWMFADLVGEDVREIYRSKRAEVTRRMCIHDRGLWKNVRLPSDLSAEERSGIRSENGWFLFSVVRDPRERLWSAWQSKFLQRDPIYYLDYFKGAEWLPRLPESPDDVIHDFGRFSHWVATHPHHRVLKDPHFASQVWRLDRQTVPFTRVYDISELSCLAEDLQHHLEAVGVPGTISLGRDNDTHLGVRGDIFAGSVREELESVCRDDLERLGDRWDFEKTLAKDAFWSDDALRTIATRAAMSERIRDLVDFSAEHERALKKRGEELRSARSKLVELEKLRQRQSVQLANRGGRIKQLEAQLHKARGARSAARTLARIGAKRVREATKPLQRPPSS